MIELRQRTINHVKEYFIKTQDEEIKRMIPTSIKTMEEAINLFKGSIKENSKSYGKTIYYNNEYIGDIWIYSINKGDCANLSYCIFNKEMWNKGIITKVIELFLKEIKEKYDLKSLNAFTFAHNVASNKALIKNNFKIKETFNEDGIESLYLIYYY